MMSKMTRDDVISEIEKVKKELEAYKNGSSNLSEDFYYPTALKKLQFLRNSLSRRRKPKGNGADR